MAKIAGLGGAFVRAADPKALYAWYEEHLGISSPQGHFSFPRETQRASIAVAFFPKSSEYFPVSQPAMLNFQVDDLDGALISGNGRHRQEYLCYLLVAQGYQGVDAGRAARWDPAGDYAGDQQEGYCAG